MNMMRIFGVAAVSAVAAVAVFSGAVRAEKAVVIPAPKLDEKAAGQTATAVLAGGCFWGMEGLFEHVKGVTSVTSGYAGGTAQTATYDQVSTEATRHAEAIRITYNPAQISYGALLRIYFSVAHNPTELNRQGPDSGISYRSAIFPQTPAQAGIAKAYIAQLGAAKAFPKPIATRIESGGFFPAEAYHQDFMRRNPRHPYITAWDVPKVAAYRAAFPTYYK
jgi:peptide-methionine (S)-S-oxide reductase